MLPSPDSTMVSETFRIVLDLPMEVLVGLSLIVLLAYTVLGIIGFGSSIVAMPLLVNVIPFQLAISMIAILDMLSSALIGVKDRSSIAHAELRLVVPFMLIGIALGATLLVNAPAKWLMLGLGIFVLGYVMYSALIRIGAEPIGRLWVAPLSVSGGVFSALFGTGGPLYAIYLARRLKDKSILRATMGAVISVSSFARIVAFGIAGLYSQADVFIGAACLVPFSILGLWCGSRLHSLLPAQRIIQGLWLLLAISGTNLIIRSLRL